MFDRITFPIDPIVLEKMSFVLVVVFSAMNHCKINLKMIQHVELMPMSVEEEIRRRTEPLCSDQRNQILRRMKDQPQLLQHNSNNNLPMVEMNIYWDYLQMPVLDEKKKKKKSSERLKLKTKEKESTHVLTCRSEKRNTKRDRERTRERETKRKCSSRKHR